jgi:hypothetical protein
MPAQHGRSLTPERIARIGRMLAAGVETAVIADAFGMSAAALAGTIKRHGLRKAPKAPAKRHTYGGLESVNH